MIHDIEETKKRAQAALDAYRKYNQSLIEFEQNPMNGWREKCEGLYNDWQYLEKGFHSLLFTLSKNNYFDEK